MEKFLDKLYEIGHGLMETFSNAWSRLTDKDKVIVGGVGIGSVVAFLLGGAIVQAGVIYGCVMLGTCAILLGYSPKAQTWFTNHIPVTDTCFTVLFLIVGLYGGVIKAIGLMFMGFYISAYLRILKAGKEVEVASA